ncbi:unnamed protein product, partial [Ectocarpus sp. 4 AP-2014]
MGSKRARPWSRQPSGGVTGSAVATAAAAFALATLSVQGTGALSFHYHNNRGLSAASSSAPACTGSTTAGTSSRSKSRGKRSDAKDAAAAAAARTAAHSEVRRRNKQRNRRREAVLSTTPSGGTGGGAAAPATTTAVSALIPPPSDNQKDSRGPSSSSSRVRFIDRAAGTAPGSATAAAAAAAEKSALAAAADVLEPPLRRTGGNADTTRATRPWTTPSPRGRGTTTSTATATATATTCRSSIDLEGEEEEEENRKAKKRQDRKRDNDVRMFLMERGLSQWEVRKVLPVMRRDPELVTDIGVLAARMQAIADLLEAAGSWHATAGEPAAAAAESDSLVSSGVTHGGGSPSSSSPPTKATEMRHVGGRSSSRRSSSSSRGGSSQEQQDDDRSRQGAQAVARATAVLLPDCGSGGFYYESRGAGVGVQEGDSRPPSSSSAAAAAAAEPGAAGVGGAAVATEESAAAAAAGAAAVAREQGGEGARLHAYQLVSSEPRLLLLRAEPELCGRLRFLLDMLPSLRGSWSARLRRAAPLLAIESSALQSRLEGLADLFPPDTDLQAIVNQTPLLLRHRTEKVSEAFASIERLVPGLRMDRVLRSAPQLLVQPLDVVEKRLAQLRAVLRLTPSPELERMRITMEPNRSSDVSIDSGSGGGRSGGGDRDDGIGRRGGGGGGGGRPAGVRILARFANGFPQILTMEPHTVRAKIEGLEALLPGMDGLALVGSRPHLLGFDVRRNVSLKVSRLRELMMDQSLPQQRRGQQQGRGQQETSTMQPDNGADASNDLVAAVARCPSLLTLSSDTSMRKVEKLQEALPSGLVARTIVAKEPRVMSLDMASTVPRKLADLARAFAEHARGTAAAGVGDSGSIDDDNKAAAAVMMAQTLRYNPNALRFDPATLARKLGVLRGAGLSAETVCRVVGGAPRCLSAAAGTLEARVSALREAFPSVPLSRLLGEAPCLLQKTIDPVAKV